LVGEAALDPLFDLLVHQEDLPEVGLSDEHDVAAGPRVQDGRQGSEIWNRLCVGL
jgi:hypothetical protein